MEKMKKVNEILKNKSSIDHAITLLHWDLETEAPEMAAEKISRTLGYLAGESYSMVINEEFKEILYSINIEELDEIDWKTVEEIKREFFSKMEKITKED